MERCRTGGRRASSRGYRGHSRKGPRHGPHRRGSIAPSQGSPGRAEDNSPETHALPGVPPQGELLLHQAGPAQRGEPLGHRLLHPRSEPEGGGCRDGHGRFGDHGFRILACPQGRRDGTPHREHHRGFHVLPHGYSRPRERGLQQARLCPRNTGQQYHSHDGRTGEPGGGRQAQEGRRRPEGGYRGCLQGLRCDLRQNIEAYDVPPGKKW